MNTKIVGKPIGKPIIGIAGKAQSGKGSLAQALAGRLTELGYTPQVLAYAEGIKQECMEFLGQIGAPASREHFYGHAGYKNSWFPIAEPHEALLRHPRFQEYLDTYCQKLFVGAGFYGSLDPQEAPGMHIGQYRTLMQWWGTEYRRRDDDRYWVNQLNAIMADPDNPHDVFIIEDLRHCVEYTDLVLQDATLIKVVRPDLTCCPNSSHSSETSLDGLHEDAWNEVVQNSGTLEEFHRLGRSLASKHFHPNHVKEPV